MAVDGKRLDSTVGTVEIHRDFEVDLYESVIWFTSKCECGWEGTRRTDEDSTASQAREAMQAEAAHHMRTAHALDRVTVTYDI